MATTRARKLHAGHFAFMRALVQGIDQKMAWDRYLRVEGQATDQRLVRSTINWIRDEFAAASRRFDRHGTARLVLLDVSRIPETEPTPSLEEFAIERGLEDFSQSDQIEAFEAAFGEHSKLAQRRARLLDKQLQALSWLEQLVAEAPHLGDGVAAWLNPSLVQMLHASDIFTLHQLLERINGAGQRWWSGIKGLGAGKAQRIQAWLGDHETSLGVAVGAHVTLKRTQLLSHELRAVMPAATAVRPLEKFLVPAELDGRAGLYRLPQAQCLLKAVNDFEAILAWLRSKQGLTPQQVEDKKRRYRHRDSGVEQGLDWLQTLSHTQRAYRKEAERFLLWAILQKGKPLSSMTNEDCVEYRNFLADPQPRTRWCGSRARARWSPLWRPFEGPLSPTAQRYAIKVLCNLYEFLRAQNYLVGNPWSSVAVPTSATPQINTGRSLSAAQWRFVTDQLDMLPQACVSHRLKVAMHLLYETGLRISEVCAARVRDLKWVVYPGDATDSQEVSGWEMAVVGKGNKLRMVPVSPMTIDALSSYLGSRGLVADVAHPENQEASLLGQASDVAARAPGLAKHHGQADPKAGIAADTLAHQVKKFFESCSKVLQNRGDSQGAKRFLEASTHWMRHTHATHSLASGTPLQVVQGILGHASISTTSVYLSTEEKRRMKAMEAFWRAGSR